MQEQEKRKENPLGTLPVHSLLMKFTVPSIVAMLTSALYNIVDQFFIGHSVGMSLGMRRPILHSHSPPAVLRSRCSLALAALRLLTLPRVRGMTRRQSTIWGIR